MDTDRLTLQAYTAVIEDGRTRECMGRDATGGLPSGCDTRSGPADILRRAS